MAYAAGNRDFEMLTKISALGIKGVKEADFFELGEQVYISPC